MEQLSKSDTARLNGAHSKGPKTARGKARSSQNAIKHGLAGRYLLMPGESSRGFNRLLAAHCDCYRPEGEVELDLVRAMALARWRLHRLSILEPRVLDNELDAFRKDACPELNRLAHAFFKSSNYNALPLLMRYEAALTRTHERAFKHLTEIQKLRNEPKPFPADHDSSRSPSPHS